MSKQVIGFKFIDGCIVTTFKEVKDTGTVVYYTKVTYHSLRSKRNEGASDRGEDG